MIKINNFNIRSLFKYQWQDINSNFSFESKFNFQDVSSSLKDATNCLSFWWISRCNVFIPAVEINTTKMDLALLKKLNIFWLDISIKWINIDRKLVIFCRYCEIFCSISSSSFDRFYPSNQWFSWVAQREEGLSIRTVEIFYVRSQTKNFIHIHLILNTPAMIHLIQYWFHLLSWLLHVYFITLK